MASRLAFALYIAIGAQAWATHTSTCCFSINVTGALHGPVEQISDGQCRIGQSGLSASKFCLDASGGLTDDQGRGCIITDLNQFQCDAGKKAQPGSSIGCDGTLALNGTAGFTACPTQQNGGYNIYTKAPKGQDGCVHITLEAAGASCKQKCPSPTPPTKSCPPGLSGSWEYPHLIIPVDATTPNVAYESQYNGTVSESVSSIFNFDIPGDDAGKTCSVVFLFPEQSQLETSAYDFSGNGVINFQRLAAPATEQTTYSNQPGAFHGHQASQLVVAPGHGYNVDNMTPCPAGERIAYKMSSQSGTCLSWFQDYNPSPIGLYVTIC